MQNTSVWMRHAAFPPAAPKHAASLAAGPAGRHVRCRRSRVVVVQSYDGNGSSNGKPPSWASNVDGGVKQATAKPAQQAQLVINERLLEETQRHLLQLNAARLNLTEQLVTANRRNLDLQRELEGLKQKVAEVAELKQQLLEVEGLKQQQLAEVEELKQQLATFESEAQRLRDARALSAAAAAAVPATAPAAPTPTRQAPQQWNQQHAQAAAPPQAAPPPQPPPPPPPPAATIVLTYSTGWHDAFIHFNADGKGWTQAPGWKLERTNNHHMRTIAIKASRLEFVMNNGHDDWDTPVRVGDKPQNYVINNPGSYRLKSGRVERL